ncbi:hypothetical protein KR009_009271 [Drosophila setifemur]|nr:hypothetical protein KR009_009271 [Drosophila setifemur]
MRVWFWIRWFLIFKCFSAGNRNIRIMLDDVVIKILDPDTLKTFACQIYLKNNRSNMDCQLFVNRNVERFTTRIVLEFTKPTGKVMKLFDVKFDACLFITTDHKNRFLNILANTVNRYSNVRCPLKANFPYKLEKLHLDEKNFPSFAPKDTFRCLYEFDTNQSKVARTMIRGKIVPWY